MRLFQPSGNFVYNVRTPIPQFRIVRSTIYPCSCTMPPASAYFKPRTKRHPTPYGKLPGAFHIISFSPWGSVFKFIPCPRRHFYCPCQVVRVIPAGFEKLDYRAVYIVNGFDSRWNLVEKHSAASEVRLQITFVRWKIADNLSRQLPFCPGIFKYRFHKSPLNALSAPPFSASYI